MLNAVVESGETKSKPQDPRGQIIQVLLTKQRDKGLNCEVHPQDIGCKLFTCPGCC